MTRKQLPAFPVLIKSEGPEKELLTGLCLVGSIGMAYDSHDIAEILGFSLEGESIKDDDPEISIVSLIDDKLKQSLVNDCWGIESAFPSVFYFEVKYNKERFKKIPVFWVDFVLNE